ncbi:hypothetical protein WICMUC_000476 [Wickerhamomyces mucosus]|uniref:nitric oxide dioxygenase n=1 Tax=Wickerhamomyces mucosus TaxID=1378264 RepID=A0A9P8TJ28_9ASCO|nr:hypothetical protein WICMUC_000476 [Wickerhamomyces mucosus]
MTLTDAQKDIIKASIPFLEENGVDLTKSFYQYMLENYPEVRPFFNKAHQITLKQPKILAFSLVAYAKNIDDLTPLLGFVRQIVEKHVGLQVKPEHYDIVGASLLKTLGDKLGAAATPEFIEAWRVAYTDLADILIQLEKDRYAEELKELEHSWPGFADAYVSDVVAESEHVKSIYFKLKDSSLKISKAYPGQYITIRFSTDGGKTIQSREYSLSNELEGDSSIDISNSFRISVKRISDGVVSNYIHDTLKKGDEVRITSPFGKLLEPYLKSKDDSEKAKPINVFVGGIGITPSVSIVEFFLKKGNKVNLFLSNADLQARIFGKWLDRLLKQYPTNFHVREFISSKDSKLAIGENHTVEYRRIDHGDVQFLTTSNVNDYQYFLVGPPSYMDFINEILGKTGLDVTKINSEEFAPVHV